MLFFFQSNNSNFYSLEKHINKLISLRKEISNRKLLVEQLREKQILASIAINYGNKYIKQKSRKYLDIVLTYKYNNNDYNNNNIIT